METICTIKAIRERVRMARSSCGHHVGSMIKVGFVPTMGYLHEGHMSLMRTAKTQCDFVVASVFVNPTQFGVNEDYDRYPKNEANDVRLAKECGVDVVFMPHVNEMYPPLDPAIKAGDHRLLLLTKVSLVKLPDIMCGQFRPSFFDGVATVVAKLLNIVQPDALYLGMKDAQQLAVVQRMVADLNIPVDVVPCPTFRETIDGLAMSSRNVYLSSEERKEANVVPVSLQEASSEAKRPGATVRSLVAVVKRRIATSTLAQLEYVQVAYYPAMIRLMDDGDAGDMLIANAQGPFILALCVRFGNTRLIDNLLIDTKLM